MGGTNSRQNATAAAMAGPAWHPGTVSDDLVARAAAYARRAHAGDVRKGSDIDYFDGHLAPVAALVAGSGGTDEQVAAAYLHDVAEDHGGAAALADIEAEFGPVVAEIVADLSDSLVDTTTGAEKPPWEERKTAYVERLRTKPVRSLEVSVADKLHNAASIVADHAEVGDEVWERFSVTDPARQCWTPPTAEPCANPPPFRLERTRFGWRVSRGWRRRGGRVGARRRAGPTSPRGRGARRRAPPAPGSRSGGPCPRPGRCGQGRHRPAG